MRIAFIETSQRNFCFSVELFCVSSFLYLGIALSEITAMIKDRLISAETSAIFLRKDLQKMYEEKIKHLGASDSAVKNVNVIRLEQAIINHVPGLCEQKSGQLVLQTLDEDISKAIFQSPTNSPKDKGIYLERQLK